MDTPLELAPAVVYNSHMAWTPSPSVVDEATAVQWVSETVPLARALVNWAEPIVHERMTVRTVPVEQHAGRYGPLMLTWFDDHRADPTLYYLRQHDIYLGVAARCFESSLGQADMVYTALSGGSRARIAITNDVLQVMTPTPPGHYSMIRHHALMFLVATLWLPTHQRTQWLEVYDLSLRAVREEVAGCADLEGLLLTIEDEAFAVFELLGADARGKGAVSCADDIDAEPLSVIGRYMIYCNAAVGLLARYMRRARNQGWEESPWLARELVRYRSDYYLFDEFEAIRQADCG